MVEIKIRGDEGEIAGRFLKPYIVAGARTFGLKPGERFSLILKNRTGQVVEARIFDGDLELRFSGLSPWAATEGYDPERGLWTLEPRQEITALSGWVARGGPQNISVRTYVDGAFRTGHTARIIPWRDLIETLRGEWAGGRILGSLRASWQLFPRFE